MDETQIGVDAQAMTKSQSKTPTCLDFRWLVKFVSEVRLSRSTY